MCVDFGALQTFVMGDRTPAMPQQTVSLSAGEDSDHAVSGRQTDGDRQSVSELVRNYGDSSNEAQKRDRSESGDAAPAGKRGARELGGGPARSPSIRSDFREYLENAVDGLEGRLMASFSRELHEFRASLTAELDKLNERVRTLERHVEERDDVIEQLRDDLCQSRTEIITLQTRIEEAEINSRLPCLILSGASMAPRRAPRLGPPLPDRTAPGAADRSRSDAPAAAALAGPGRGHLTVTSRPADGPGGGAPGQSAPGARGERGAVAARSGDVEEREDVNALVVNTLNQSMPGLGITVDDIDRAHRLPGAGHRVIVRFVRSGEGSVRDRVMARRLELRGRELFVNESLTRLRSQIFRSLLAAKREKKIYTVFSRGGHVFFKKEQHGVGKRVDSLKLVRELGFSVLER